VFTTSAVESWVRQDRTGCRRERTRGRIGGRRGCGPGAALGSPWASSLVRVDRQWPALTALPPRNRVQMERHILDKMESTSRGRSVTSRARPPTAVSAGTNGHSRAPGSVEADLRARLIDPIPLGRKRVIVGQWTAGAGQVRDAPLVHEPAWLLPQRWRFAASYGNDGARQRRAPTGKTWKPDGLSAKSGFPDGLRPGQYIVKRHTCHKCDIDCFLKGASLYNAYAQYTWRKSDKPQKARRCWVGRSGGMF